ncbi:MAG: hypothetical protein EA342_02765 [Leptolyngbya sp. LCM1.Bin17]|nr:MAG: hypothetical protein EA342_02765 [Leptolyngbya sp. LCM1.Bin17]
MSTSETVLAVLVPAAIWVTVLAFTLAMLFALDDGIRRLRRLHQIPCYRCRFYTGSPYLKCPVHPIDAGSEVAITCQDYEQAEPSGLPSTPPI